MMLGRALVTTAALALIATGLVWAWTSPPLSGATIGAACLITLGGAALARLVHVARRLP